MAQALGKVPLPPLSELNIDSASFSAHKIGGPRGIGVLYLRRPVNALYRGGGQERGVRPGTENTAGALAFARLIEERACGQAVRAAHAGTCAKMGALIRGFRAIEGCSIIPECRTEDDPRFSPYILQAAFRGVAGEVMARALDDAGFAVSTGSACSSASKERPVLAAMGVSPALAFTSIRVSICPDTALHDIAALVKAASELAGMLGG
jgi:cysteine desulfurase